MVFNRIHGDGHPAGDHAEKEIRWSAHGLFLTEFSPEIYDFGAETWDLIGLRLTSDVEFLELGRKALQEHLSEDEIKRAIQDWRADHYQV